MTRAADPEDPQSQSAGVLGNRAADRAKSDQDDGLSADRCVEDLIPVSAPLVRGMRWQPEIQREQRGRAVLPASSAWTPLLFVSATPDGSQSSGKRWFTPALTR